MVKCCGKYNARQLRARVKIQRKTQASDGMGGWTETWSRGDDLWALWKPMSGSERVRAMGIEPTLAVKAVIRFRGDENGAPYYSAADRLTYRGRTYNIKTVIDVDGMQDWLELMLAEGEPS